MDTLGGLRMTCVHDVGTYVVWNLHTDVLLMPSSFCEENVIHLAHHEGNTGRVGLQGPFCRYTFIRLYANWNLYVLCIKITCLFSPGFMPRVIKVAPACAVMISSYEFGKAFFQKMNLDREQLALWRRSLCRWLFVTAKHAENNSGRVWRVSPFVEISFFCRSTHLTTYPASLDTIRSLDPRQRFS